MLILLWRMWSGIVRDARCHGQDHTERGRVGRFWWRLPCRFRGHSGRVSFVSHSQFLFQASMFAKLAKEFPKIAEDPAPGPGAGASKRNGSVRALRPWRSQRRFSTLEAQSGVADTGSLVSAWGPCLSWGSSLFELRHMYTYIYIYIYIYIHKGYIYTYTYDRCFQGFNLRDCTAESCQSPPMPTAGANAQRGTQP